MAKTHFKVIDILIAIFSLATFIIDVGTDIAAGVHYFLEGRELAGWLTVAFVLLPAIVMSLFSVSWHIHDKTMTPLIMMLHILPFAPVQRYTRVVHLGLKSRQTHKVVHTQRALRALNDVSILRLIEAFMESAPQLVLQLYIMIYSERVDWLTGFSAGSSLLSLSWAMTAYSDSLRRAHTSGYQQHLLRLILHWGWQLFMSGSRIAAFVFLAAVIHQWLLLGMGGHWLMAFVWISFKGTDFGNGLCERWMFRLVCAFIYIFVFLNLNDGNSRWRIAAFYLITFIENAVMVAVYIVSAEGGNMVILSCVTVFGGFTIGLVCMLIYYGFFHPSGGSIKGKRPSHPKAKMFSLSQTSVMFSPGGGVQIFNLESPTSVKTTIRGTSANLNSEKDSSHHTTESASQSWASSHTSRRFMTNSILSPEKLQEVWQKGAEMSSDSSDTSSLASVEILRKNLEYRPSSRNSDKSGNSATSDNYLLPPLSRNDLSKSSDGTQRFQMKESILKKNCSGEVSGSNSINIHSNAESPTLSRGSWARSSDYRQSQGVEDIVTLVLDDSSSTDRRGSDSSLYNSRPKNLSPLNVASLWQDVHSKLRQTIAATVAAATGNLSSNEGTPNRSRSSSSQNTTGSSQEADVSSHFPDSMSENNSKSKHEDDKSNSVHNGSMTNGRQREAMCSLPDILEAVENEAISDISGSEANAVKFTRQNDDYRSKDDGQHIPSLSKLSTGNNTKMDDSPFLEDSTLTASKLVSAKPKSYLDHTKAKYAPSDLSSCMDNQIESEAVATSGYNQHEEFSQDWARSTRNSKGHSPFTDQELVSVMANSLQSYMGYSSPSASNRDREGLALTIDDLRFSPQSVSDAAESLISKNRSPSSVFHESGNSSPISTASKMQRQADANRSREKISPNALKHIEDIPPSLRQTFDFRGIPDSQALLILREAYANSVGASPMVRTNPSKANQQFSSGQGRKRENNPPERPRNHNSNTSGIRKYYEGYHDQNKPPKQNQLQLTLCESESYYNDISQHALNRDTVLFDSIALQKSKLMGKNGKSKRSNGFVHAGKSVTKRLSIHDSSFKLEDYASSPKRQGRMIENSSTGSLPENYVKGKYCPPLCEVSDDICENLNHQENFPTKDSKSKQIQSYSDTSKQCMKRLALLDTDNIDYLRKEIMKRDQRLSYQESDFFNLHKQEPVPYRRQYRSSISQPNLRTRNSQVPRERRRALLDEAWRNETRFEESPRQSKSYQRSMHSTGHCHTFDHSNPFDSFSDQERETSANHVVDYFSHALDSQNHKFSHDPIRQRKRTKHFSQPDLGIHRSRPPLRSLHNSPFADH